MEKVEKTIATNIRILRISLNMSQSDLAEKADMSLRGIQAIESEGSAPRASTLSKIAMALGVTEASLYKDPHKPFEASGKADLLTLLYSIAPTLNEDSLKEVVDLALRHSRK